ncbi:MAG: ABC transporter ATP-binding protein [Trebonia sp.]
MPTSDGEGAAKPALVGDRPLLDLRDVSVQFNQVVALQSVTLQVHKGEAVAILGPNGAGKTTTMRTISGVLRPRRGEVHFDGRRIDRMSAPRVARLGIGSVPEGRRVFSGHTVAENLQLGGYLLRRNRAAFGEQLDMVLTLFPRLGERRKQLAGTLSGGEAQMLAIGRALMLRPTLLMLDEPSLGLAPRVVAEMYEHLKHLHVDAGLTILLVEQAAVRALEFADRAYLMSGGTVVVGGPSAQMREHPEVQRVYFGANA